jgi:hypothetical protein
MSTGVPRAKHSAREQKKKKKKTKTKSKKKSSFVSRFQRTARAGLAVGENCGVVALNDVVDRVARGEIVNLFLCRRRVPKNAIECECEQLAARLHNFTAASENH